MASITFSGKQKLTQLYFRDISVNDSFIVDTPRSQGAVYRKVKFSRDANGGNWGEYMMEEATGKLYDPTTSPIKRVDVSVSVDGEKPSIYEDIPF